MDVKKTTCHPFYPILLGVSTTALVGIIVHKILKKSLPFSYGSGLLTGTTVTLLSLGCQRGAQKPSRKLSVWEEKVAVHLRKANISDSIIDALDENNLAPISLKLWDSLDYELPRETKVLSLKSGATFTIYDKIPIHELILSKDELENFTVSTLLSKTGTYRRVFIDDKNYLTSYENQEICFTWLEEQKQQK